MDRHGHPICQSGNLNSERQPWLEKLHDELSPIHRRLLLLRLFDPGSAGNAEAVQPPIVLRGLQVRAEQATGPRHVEACGTDDQPIGDQASCTDADKPLGGLASGQAGGIATTDVGADHGAILGAVGERQ